LLKATDQRPVVGSRREPRGGKGPRGAEKTAKTTTDKTTETPNFAQARRVEGRLVKGGWSPHGKSVWAPWPSADSGDILDGPVDDLVAVFLIVQDQKGPGRRDVVGLPHNLALRSVDGHPLPDRPAGAPVLFHHQRGRRVPVARVDVVHLLEEVLKTLLVRYEEVHFPLEAGRALPHLRGKAIHIEVRVDPDSEDDMVDVAPIHAFGKDSREL
jgi:hypothetical protein